MLGAIQSALAIKRCVPILHTTSGCGMQHYLGCGFAGGCQGSRYDGLSLPSTNVTEKHVIFGGSSRLREQIKNTLRIVEGDLYVVLSGCAPDIVGDDSRAMTKEARDQGYPVIYAQAAGFTGNAYRGYEILLKALVEEYGKSAKSPEKIDGIVNIFGIVPGQDIFWHGDMEELKRILALAGLKANTIFGYDQGIEALQSMSSASLSIVLGPWGSEVAGLLQERYEIPTLNWSYIPVGNEDTNSLLESIAKILEIDHERFERLKLNEENRFFYYLERIANAYFDFGFQEAFDIVAPSSYAVGITRFLSGIGFIPNNVIITDNPPENYRKEVTEKLTFAPLAPVAFIEDFAEIEDCILKKPGNLILGSTLERKIAQKHNVPHLSISFPITGSVVLNKGYAGYNGSISLMEDAGSSILLHRQCKRPMLIEREIV
jgi:nitrogenase molybdenum-iron protein beta chain